MKRPYIAISLPRILATLFFVGGVMAVASQNVGKTYAAVPTGSFTANSCSWDASHGDYKYTISAKWSDADAGTDPANAYLGSSTSKGNYGGAGSSTASDSLDNISHNGPSYTWTFYRATLIDSKWPVRLWVHDIGNSTTPWHLAISANRPSCPAPSASLKVNGAASATVTANSNVTLSWSSSNVKGCSAGGSWSGSKALSGSLAVNVGTGNKSYTLNCSNAYGGYTAQVFVTVNNPPAPPASGGSGSGSTGTKKPTGGSSGSGSSNTTPAPNPTAPPTSDADGTASSGTISAKVTVPAGNAATIHLTYSAAGQQPSASQDVTVSGSTAVIELDNLLAKTDYAYQIVRTNDIGSTTSPVAGFTTGGYVIGLHFVDGNGKGISGIAGVIDADDSSKLSTGNDGWLRFKDQDDGTHTITYVYRGKTHTKTFDTSTAQIPDDPSSTVNLTDTVDLSKLVTGTTKKSSGSKLVFIIPVIVLLLGALIWFVLRRRRRRQTIDRLTTPVSLGSVDALDQPSFESYAAHPAPPQSMPEHAGQSLRDMVVQSMHQTAPAQTPPDASAPLPPQPVTTLPPSGFTAQPPVAPPATDPYATPQSTLVAAPADVSSVPPIPRPDTPLPSTSPPLSNPDENEPDDAGTIQIQH